MTRPRELVAVASLLVVLAGCSLSTSHTTVVRNCRHATTHTEGNTLTITCHPKESK